MHPLIAALQVKNITEERGEDQGLEQWLMGHKFNDWQWYSSKNSIYVKCMHYASIYKVVELYSTAVWISDH